jgi:hypothetical protein
LVQIEVKQLKRRAWQKNFTGLNADSMSQCPKVSVNFSAVGARDKKSC